MHINLIYSWRGNNPGNSHECEGEARSGAFLMTRKDGRLGEKRWEGGEKEMMAEEEEKELKKKEELT